MSFSVDLKDKVAVVTGGTGALGSAMCRALANAGARVAIMATTEAKTRALAEQIRAAGGTAISAPANVLDHESLLAAEGLTASELGVVDILVNAAGGNKPQATTAADRTFFDLPQEALDWVFDLNLMGTLLPTQIFGRGMAERGSGSIVNISSMAAQRPLTRVVGYAAAKAGIDNFTRWLAVHMATEYNPAIRVNAIAPGFFLGDQNRALLIDQRTGDLTPRGQQIIAHTPMRRFGEPDELIGALLWLVSDAARFVTGIIVPVDGGFSAYGGV